MRTKTAILSLFPMMVWCAAVHAADKPCSPADAAVAEKAIDRVVTWGNLHKAYQDYKHCDKGAVAEGYTEALLRLTVEWKNVNAFADAVNKDAGFKDFVRTHLQSPAAKDDADSVYSRTRNQCPKGLDGFCTELGGMVKAAAPAAAAGDAMQPVPMMQPINTRAAEPAKPAAK
jgi:hypothetical protein